MNNYQLYRTNVLLGGQVCWDIILENDKNQLYAKDLHITPINHNIPFNYLPDKYDVNYEHQYNIKELYKDISANFYKSYINPKLETSHPIISEEEYNTHDQTYEMGCQRIHQDIYGKQFEFFCPVWLEHLSSDDILSFTIQISNQQNRIIAQKNIEFKIFDNKDRHNKIVKYFTDYIKYCHLNEGNDDILKIDLSNKIAYLSGLEVSSGNQKLLQNNTMVRNLLFRERPLLEFDSLMINEFKQAQLISHQLFNFRFLFNLDDIINPITYKLIQNGKFIISVYTNINSKLLPLKDFYNNFEFIPRESDKPIYSTEWNKDNKNVLDYLQDYKSIDLLNLNKMNPINIHWSLAGNNDYIFNIYKGFAGYSEDIDYEYSYGVSPILKNKYYDNTWCNIVKFNNDMQETQFNPIKNRIKDNNLDSVSIYDIWTYPEDISKYLAKEFKGNEPCWVNHIKYNAKFEKMDSVHALTGYMDEDIDINKVPAGFVYYKNLGLNIIIWEQGRMVIIISNNKKDLGYNKIIKSISDIDNDILKDLIKILKTNQDIPAVKFTNSLLMKYADSPNLNSTEIEYIKNNNTEPKYLLRYDGKLKPTFVDETMIYKNFFYYKEILKLNQLQQYKKYLYLDYEPLYPSLNFYYIKHLLMDYHSPDKYDYLDKFYEYKWFNNSLVMVLFNEIILDFDIEGEITFDKFIAEKNKSLKEKLNLKDEELDFYNKKYNYTVIDDFIKNNMHHYTTKLTLL